MLFDGTYGRGGVAAAVADPALLQALLDVEAALARAHADLRRCEPPAGAGGACAGGRTRRRGAPRGGPVGHGDPALADALAERLGLVAPALPWHANRVRVAQLAGALGVLAGALGKIARDVTLLSQDELGELREGGPAGRGGSSAMAHKRNPVAAISVLACTRRVPGLVATLLACMEQEEKRAAGAWQAEWGTISELLRLTGPAAASARHLHDHLK